jgi:hypothetical protein
VDLPLFIGPKRQYSLLIMVGYQILELTPDIHDMNQQTPEPLVLPSDNPPSRRSTVALTVVSITLVLIWLFVQLNTLTESADIGHQVFNLFLLFWFLPVAFVLACVAITVETSRIKFRKVVEEYARKTGDMRYNPYILPAHPFFVIGGNLLWMFLLIAAPIVIGLVHNG